MNNHKSLRTLLKINIERLLRKDKLSEKVLRKLIKQAEETINGINEKDLKQKGFRKKLFWFRPRG